MASLKAIFKLYDGYSSTIEKIDKNTEKATRSIIKASGETDKYNRKLGETGDKATKASLGLGKFISAAALAAAAVKGMNISDEYSNTAARLDLINDGLRTQAELQEQIFAAADRSRGSYNSMADAVAKLRLNASDAFRTNDEAIAFTELLQKSFKLSGSSAAEQASAMLQLTQALSSGRLQGDEFRSIMENAPMVADAIAKYMGKSKGELKDLSKEGAITASVIKGAIFNAADDINNKFSTMPVTFSDIFTSAKNQALKAFRPLFEQISDMLTKDDTFKKFTQDAVAAISRIASVATKAFGILTSIAGVLYRNWSWLSPLIWGVVAAMIAYNAMNGVAWVLTLKNIAATIWKTAVDWYQVAVIFALTVAQKGLNAALLACPLSWIIVTIIMLIAIFYAVIGAINKFAGTSLSATGIILGAFAVLGAFIWNTFLGVLNALIQLLWSRFVEPWIGIVEWVLNVFNGGFNSFGDAVKNLLGNLISYFLSFGQVVTKIIDAIFGTDWTSGLQSLKNKVLGWGKNENSITLKREAPTIGKRIEYGAAWNAGYALGEKASNLIKNFGADNTTEGIYKGVEQTAENTERTANALDISNETLEYMRDIARREYINKFTTATLAPNVSISFGDVHEEADVDKIHGRISQILREEIAMVAEGAYS